jgi:hypothetical protein
MRAGLKSFWGVIEIPLLQAKRGFVMPAKAGIHHRIRGQAKENLDSGLRRNDQTKSRLLVDELRTPRLEPRGLV